MSTSLNKFANSEVELCRVGSVNGPVGRCPSLQFSALLVIVEKLINIDHNSYSQTAMESVWSVSKLLTESVGSRHEIVAISVHKLTFESCRRRRCVPDTRLKTAFMYDYVTAD